MKSFFWDCFILLLEAYRVVVLVIPDVPKDVEHEEIPGGCSLADLPNGNWNVVLLKGECVVKLAKVWLANKASKLCLYGT